METKFLGKKIDWKNMTQDDFKVLEKEIFAEVEENKLRQAWFKYLDKELDDVDYYLLSEVEDEEVYAFLPELLNYEDWKKANSK